MFFSLVKNKNFMRLWITQTLSQTESTIVDFSVALFFAKVALDPAMANSGLGESATAIVFALQYLPALPAALIAGVIADIFDRRTLMLATNIFRSVFLLLFVFAADAGPQLYIFVLVMAVCMHTYDVYEKATLRNVVTEEQLGLATGLFLFTLNATTLIGVVVAGILVQNLPGLHAIFLSGAAFFVIASIVIYGLPKNINNFHVDHYEQNENILVDTSRAFKKITTSLKQSFDYLISKPPVWISVVLATVVQTVTLMIASVSFYYGEQVVHISLDQVSVFLLIPIAMGMAIGGGINSFFTKRFGYRRLVNFSWFIASILLFVLGMIGFITQGLRVGVTFEFILFEALIVIMGVFVTLIQSPALELIQKFADPKVRGRVFGILVGATNTIAGILVAISSILVADLKARGFIVFLSILLLTGLFLFQFVLRKFLGNKDYTEYVDPAGSVLQNQNKLI